MMKNNRKRKIIRRIISFFMAVVFIVGCLPLSDLTSIILDDGFGLVHTVSAANTHISGVPHTINNVTDLINLSQQDPSTYEYDLLYFANAIPDILTAENFTPLGSTDHPFKGKIRINQMNQSNFSFISEVPLFDYIADSVEITFNNDTGKPPIAFQRSSDNTGLPLFANHVVHDTDEGATLSAGWVFQVDLFVDTRFQDEPEYSYNYAGLIGSVGREPANSNDPGDGTVINIEFTNYTEEGDSYSNIYSTADAGLICGTINKGAVVNVKLNGYDTSYTVQSTNGSAGRFVGTMYEGSKLNVITDVPAFLSNNSVVTATEYAGSIVGYCEKATVSFKNSSDAALSLYANGTITGGSSDSFGAGGLFGYYENSTSVEFDLSTLSVDCTVIGKNAGGLFGKLVSNGDITVKDGTVTVAAGNGVSNFGGIAGSYKANNGLTDRLLISNVTANTSAGSFASGNSYYGGVAGYIDTNNAYVEVSDFIHDTSAGCNQASVFGGVIATTANTASMTNISGNLTLDTNGTELIGGGVIGYMNKGVLRLSGMTDMSSAQVAESHDNGGAEDVIPSYSCGQIVGYRDAALVYAVGSGNDYTAASTDPETEITIPASGWSFNRYVTGDQHVDDIDTWGEVVRVSSDTSSEDTLYFDSTAHTVRIAAAETTIDSKDDFVRTALNIQLNGGSDVGSLCFANKSASSSTNLLGTALNVSGTINLEGTGITGFTRDDGTNGNFTGPLTGSSNATINLATGEYYGANIGSSSTLGNGRGEIYRHKYNGLFAKTGTNAAFTNVAITGCMNIGTLAEKYYVGSLAAYISGTVSMSDIDIHHTLNAVVFNNSKDQFLGGLIGYVDSAHAGDVSLIGTAADKFIVRPTINVNIKGVGADKNSDTQYIGGTISRIESVKTFNINATAVKISPIIEVSNTATKTHENLVVGGFIASIVGNKTTDTRTVNLNDVTVSGISITGNDASSHMGGLLGYEWINTNVNTPSSGTGITVSGTNTITTNAIYSCGLLSRATGYWNIKSNGIIINNLSCSGRSTGFGMIALYGHNGTDSAIYLELNEIDSYKLAGTGVTVPSSCTDYDELVTYSSSDVLANNSGVISIRTKNTAGTVAAEYSMDETNCNSYQNVYNTGKINSHSRYYYNVSAHKDDTTAGSGWALLNWSLCRYAAANIRDNFADPTLSGTYDLTNISYYPVDISANNETLSNDITVVFHNDKIETTEGLRESGEKLTTNASQHYLMHYGLFRNVSKSLATGGNLHFKGVAGNDASYSGVLVCGSLTGGYSSSKSKEIVLEGISFNNTSAASKYLLIHSIGSGTSLTLSGVRTGGGLDIAGTMTTGETKYAAGASVADSLIGDVVGTGVTFDFSRIKLDARISADDDTIFGTTKSIFSNATLFNKLDTDGTSVMTYNYAEEADWNNGTHIGSVTYGKEITNSVEYANQEDKYYDSTRNYTNATTTPNATSGTDFSTGYLPYVKWYSDTLTGAPTPTYSLREIKVNVKISGITKGCGTYNHPYEISEDNQLPIIANAIAGKSMPDQLRLPMVSNNGSSYSNTSEKNHWCENKEGCAVFEYDSENKIYTYSTFTWKENYVRLYLASAYYKVTNNITLPEDYIGLGGGVAGGDYSFRGVIVGANDSVTITNRAKVVRSETATSNYNTMGLVSTSHGCVIKDLTIVADLSNNQITDLDNGKTYRWNYRIGELKAYDYNEEFPNYGAVINKIMGGDNIIDNVTVKFDGVFKIQQNNNHDQKATIGGYVGCVVNGALIFRNIDDNDLQHLENGSYVSGFVVNRTNTNDAVQNSRQSGKTITNLTEGDNHANMFVNPFVGRVINGYAIRETTDNPLTEEKEARFAGSEDGETYSDGRPRSGVSEVTMHNTRKNWSIPDINKDSSNILTFSEADTSAAIYKSGTYNKITVPDAQSLYIMSIIAQSGSGSANSELSSGNNHKYNISYNGNSQPTSKNVYKGGYKATHLAQYNQIGTNNTTDYDVSLNDSVGDSTAVPYLIYAYTSSYTKTGEQGGKPLYPARCLTRRVYAIELSETEQTYHLPDSFRGIGFMGANNWECNMRIYGFNGHGCTIDMNTYCSNYVKDQDPFYNNTIGDMYVGVGLFTRVSHRAADGNVNNVYNPTNIAADEYENYQIGNFELTGYICGASREYVGTIKQTETDHSRVKQKYFFTAGVVALIWNKDNERYLNFVDIDFNDLYIQGSGTGGTLVSCINAGMIYANNCNASNLTIEGGSRVGGFIGTADDGATNAAGANAVKSGFFVNANVPNASTTLNNLQVKQMLDSNSHTASFAGGLIGGYWGKQIESYKDSSNVTVNEASFIFHNITITSDNATGSFIGCAVKDNSGNYKNYGYVGGIIGNDERSAGCVVKNCKIEKTNMYGYCVGGILGANLMSTKDFDDFKNDSAGLRIVDCLVSGEINEGTNKPKYILSGSLAAGGIIGYDGDWKTNTELCTTFNYDIFKYQVDGCHVKDYEIKASGAVNSPGGEDTFAGCGAGGLLGVINVETFTLVNSKVDQCIISTDRISSERGVGGIIGYARNNGYDNTTSLANKKLTQGKLNATKGYNIVVSNNTLYNVNNSSDTQVGTIIGYATKNSTFNTDNAFDIEIAGFSRKGNKDNSGNALQYDIGRSGSETITMPSNFTANGSYIVYADFTGANATKTWSFDDADNADVSGLFKSGVENVDTMGAAPYASVLPFTSMGTNEVITGDGASLKTLEEGQTEEKYKMIAKAIIDCDTNEKYGIYSVDDSTRVSGIIDANENAAIRLTTYESEVGVSPTGADFPIIAIGDTLNHVDEIRSYVKVLTNTDMTYFGEVDNSKYGIDVLRCQYDSSTGNYYVVDATNAGLEYANSALRMVESKADTNQPNSQISVIDIKFYDPAYTAEQKVAYHLYIPVLTKKMVKFNFSSAAVSGSDYLNTLYTNKFGQNAAENFDNWVTMYARFTYPASELQAVVDAGIGLEWNNDKSVRLMYNMNQSIGNNTRFVLVDPNGNRDNVYYAKKSDTAVTTRVVNNYAQDILDFSGFRDSDNNNDYTPISLNELVRMTYSSADDATYKVYVETTKDDSEMIAYAYAVDDTDGSTIKYFKKAPDNTSATKYALTVTNDAIEDYYISMYAEESDNRGRAYEFTLQSPLTLTGGRMSRLNTNLYTTILLGDLFTQSVTLTGLNPRNVITTSNNYLNATAETTVSFINSENLSYVKGKFIDGKFELYQIFVLRLNRVDEHGNADADQQIHSSPSCVITGDNSYLEAGAEASVHRTITEGAAYIQSLPVKINTPTNNSVTGWTDTVQSVYEITFPANETILEKEFSSRQVGDYNGIYLSVNSNLLYNAPGSAVNERDAIFSDNTVPSKRQDTVYYLSKESQAELMFDAINQEDIYDKNGKLSENTSPLGLNAYYLENDVTRENIKADIIFDLSQFSNIDVANNVKFTLSLAQKNDTGGYGKYGDVTLDDYINNVNLFDASGNNQIGVFSSGNSYTVQFNKELDANDEWTGDWIATFGENNDRVKIDYDAENKIFTAMLKMDVLTGSEFEAVDGYKYANYKINLDASLNTVTGNNISQFAHDTDHIVYTNAKINAEFVSVAE